MEFEYDPRKSASNKEKHGIDFEEAKALWADEGLLESPIDAVGEERSILTGLIGNRHWTAIVSYRNGNIRIISVRRARAKEIREYEEKNND